VAQPTDEVGVINSKPSYLQILVRTWIEDGERMSSEIQSDPPLDANER